MLVTVTGTIYDSSDGLASGTLTLSWQGMVSAQGHTIIAGSREIAIVNGVLNVQVEDNATANPANTSYVAQWSLVNSGDSTAYWVVPASATPVDISQVQTFSVTGPSAYVAANYQYVANSGTNLPQRQTLNLQPRIVATDDSGNNRTNVDLQALSSSGTWGSATQVPVLTVDGYGRITGVTPTGISFPGANPSVLFKAANYTIQPTDGTNIVVLADATAGPITITLYTPVGHQGAEITVVKKKTDTSTNQVNIATAAGTIDGGISVTLATPGQGQTFVSDNSDWWTSWSNSVGKTLKGQIFTSTGTFTPSPALIAAGGWVNVEYLVGSGAGGGTTASSNFGGGGGAQVIKNRMIQITTSQTVTIAGSAAANTAGSASSIGAILTAAGGTVSSGSVGGASGASFLGGSGTSTAGGGGGGAGGPGQNPPTTSGVSGYGGPGIEGYGVGGNGQLTSPNAASPANSGKGGDFNQASGSGYCALTWYE